jgi:hypothetical protein
MREGSPSINQVNKSLKWANKVSIAYIETLETEN